MTLGLVKLPFFSLSLFRNSGRRGEPLWQLCFVALISSSPEALRWWAEHIAMDQLPARLFNSLLFVLLVVSRNVATQIAEHDKRQHSFKVCMRVFHVGMGSGEEEGVRRDQERRRHPSSEQKEKEKEEKEKKGLEQESIW
jgi:hypothetical protein